MKVMGHRGGFLPENTMLGFSEAVKNGIDAIELDVNKHDMF
jgi:glycerophosphoryl diester phosphodiesterase